MFSFKLSDEFIAQYKEKPVDWGFKDAAGNALGEITFLRTYSRLKEDGSKERWYEVCRRVVEGMYSIQKDHVKSNRLPWNDNKSQKSAQYAFDAMFNFKWTPPGRGIFMMGTPLVMEQRNSAALQNCSFISTFDMTKNDPSYPFAFLMEASMLGVAVGFDTRGVEKDFEIYEPKPDTKGEYLYVVPDTREGWVESTKKLINSYLKADRHTVSFDYSQVRPAGALIKTFGGTAAGPDPLIKLHEGIRKIFKKRAGSKINTMDIMDIANLIGVCVVSGNVRRSAELAMGSLEDEAFLNSKNYGHVGKNGNWVEGPAAKRQEWGWMSNNSVGVKVGDDLSKIVPLIQQNGEPGVIWLDVTRNYGRLVDAPDGKDWRVAGFNPCAEQPLESQEMCTLVEVHLNRHTDLEDLKKTLKVAYLYGKTITLLPTHWDQTNAIMQRNRRIGLSMSGIANFADNRGLPVLKDWMDKGYHFVGELDRQYSEWLCVRESIRMTTVKPSGSVSILSGESPGVHWQPGGEYFNRGIVFSKDDPMVFAFQQAGYKVEKSAYTPETSVFVQFPIHSAAKRSEKEVSIFEKAQLAATAQRYWSDNGVSVTISFNPETEAKYIGNILSSFEGQFKAISFLPSANDTYKQMPYQDSNAKEHEKKSMELFPIDWSPIYDGTADFVLDASGEKYCTTDFCEVKVVKNENEK
jgi:ribonucleoside-triphosphate reductase